MAKVYILIGADDYLPHHVLDVYATRELAEADIKSEKHLLISRQGEPIREILEKEIIDGGQTAVRLPAHASNSGQSDGSLENESLS